MPRASCRCSTSATRSASSTNIRSSSTRRLEAETGQDVGFRQVTNIRLARTQDRLDEYKYYAGVAAHDRRRGQFPEPREVKEIWPLCNVDGIIGAIQHPEDGYIQPADLTQALARAAREAAPRSIATRP